MQEGIPALIVADAIQWAGAPELNKKGGNKRKASIHLSSSLTMDAV